MELLQDNQLGVDVMSGCECIEALRARGCTSKILMVTGAKIEKEDGARYKAAGWVPHLLSALGL